MADNTLSSKIPNPEFQEQDAIKEILRLQQLQQEAGKLFSQIDKENSENDFD